MPGFATSPIITLSIVAVSLIVTLFNTLVPLAAVTLPVNSASTNPPFAARITAPSLFSMSPCTSPITLPTVISPAAKSPFASRNTIVFAELASVALDVTTYAVPSVAPTGVAVKPLPATVTSDANVPTVCVPNVN